MKIIILLIISLVGLFILTGSILGIVFKKNKKLIDFSISIFFGIIITFIAIKLIPKVLEISLEYLGIWKGVLISSILAFLGFIIIQQIDLFIPHHEMENKQHKHKCLDEHLKHIGLITCIVFIIFNIIEGMILYMTSVSNAKIGILYIEIILQNIPLGLFITSVFINTCTKNKIITISSIISLSTLLGGLLAFISGINNILIMGLLLSVILGMIIYISFCELTEKVLSLKDKKTRLIGITAGIIIVIINVIGG